MMYLFYFLVFWLIVSVAYNSVMRETYNTNPEWWEVVIAIPYIFVSWIGYFVYTLYKKWK